MEGIIRTVNPFSLERVYPKSVVLESSVKQRSWLPNPEPVVLEYLVKPSLGCGAGNKDLFNRRLTQGSNLLRAVGVKLLLYLCLVYSIGYIPQLLLCCIRSDQKPFDPWCTGRLGK